MARPAYILLDANGVVVRTHKAIIASGGVLQGSTPTTNATDLETTIAEGYGKVREVPLEGGKVLIVLEHI